MNTIKIQIEDEKYLYNTLNPDEDSFTDDVKAYILRYLDKTDTDHEIMIRFLSARPLSEERIKKAAALKEYDVIGVDVADVNIVTPVINEIIEQVVLWTHSCLLIKMNTKINFLN